jgi:hypothetical protein
MVCWSIKNDLNVVYELYIKRGCLLLEVFFFFFSLLILLYSKASTTLKQLQILSCSDFLKHTSSTFVLNTISHYLLPISEPAPNPTHYTGTSSIILYVILNVSTSLDRL